MGGGGSEIETTSGLSGRFQQPIQRQLGQFLTNALSGPQPSQPAISDLPQVFDPAITRQLFETQFLNPTLRQLSGPGGAISRVGAQAAQRGTFFSSGRQQNEANVVGDAAARLGQGFAGLVGQDQARNQAEFLRRQPLSSPITRQALNFLGIPMVTVSQNSNSGLGGLIGAGVGAAAGTLVAPGAGTLIGAQAGGAIGSAF